MDNKEHETAEDVSREVQDDEDECDLDQLAAFLEEPDSDDCDVKPESTDIINQTGSDTDTQDNPGGHMATCLRESDSDNEVVGQGSADTDMNAGTDTQDNPDIQLADFLGESDSDEDEDVPGTTSNTEHTSHPSALAEVDTDFQEEFDDDDGFDELASLIESQDMENESADGAASLSDGEPSMTPTGPDSMETDSVAMVPDDSDCENVVSVATEECDSEADVSENEDGDIDKNEIRAAMQAMAERMKKLEAMLAKKSGKTKKKKNQSPDGSSNKTSKNKQTTCSVPKSEKQFTSTSLTKKQHSTKLDGRTKDIASAETGSSPRLKASDKTDNVKLNGSHKDRSNRASANKSGMNSQSSINSVSMKEMTAKPSSSFRTKLNDKIRSPNVKQRVTESEDKNLFFDETTTETEPDPGVGGDEPAVDPKFLFGDSDNSDWEGMDEEDKRELTDQGKVIKKLMSTGPRQRTAHAPTYDTELLKKPTPNAWIAADQRSFMNTDPVRKTKAISQQPPKPQINPETGTVSGKYHVRDEYKTKPATAAITDIDEKEVSTDPFCGIRILNPRISMAELKCKMAGRAMIKIPRLLSKYGKQDLQKDNWVTMGVVVHRTEPRQSAAGKPFCIWKLSDLQDCDKTVTFFLFGNVYKEHWKNELGVVIGLLNPSTMDKAEKAQSEIAFTINHPQQMLIIGVAKDLGRCRGTTKSGQPCSCFINKSQGEYCSYHVQAAYRKSSSKRTELQASTGSIPKAFEKKGQRNSDGFYIYGGQSFSMRPAAKSTKDTVTLKKLQSLEAAKERGKITTMSLHDLEPQDSKRLQTLKEKDKALLDMLSVPSSGSMNFVKHLVHKDTKKQVTDASEQEQAVVQSASATDLLKEHKQRLVIEKKGKQLLTSLPKLGKGFGQGQEISLDAPVKKTNLSAELAKQLAIAKVKSKGGIAKEDPNAVRNKLVSPEAKEKIKKRVREDIDMEASGSDKETAAPPKKRSKMLGNVDLNSPEVQKLLKSKSKHLGALAEAEAEHEDRYFSQLEKKEKMEDKMAAVMEQAATLFYCKQCDYKHFSLHDRCKKENHHFVRVKGMKRFFKCKDCKRRLISVERYPSAACGNCGGTKFERVSMLIERSGPKLESEQLSLRGNEQKYLGSLQQKSFLNVT